ncbi:MAG: flagellar biosynthesis protein FlhA [Thermodesulfobacteriota bacterium]
MATVAEKGGGRHNLAEMLLPVGVVGILVVMIVPLPTFIMDLFLATNIACGIAILLISLYILKPLHFSIFPSVLLIATIFRLSLNVASTRLILLHGNEGTQAAGQVIRSFGNFVVGGNYAVGLVVFMILVIINFVVITKGAGRIAEVSARFTLDAMPGKQMAIDADLNSGLIGEDDARTRRSEISREAEFYGAMDGASKFVRGDAIAGILITMINIVGGIVIGVLQQKMNITDALSIYTILTIGDGLVAQIPALVISTAAGIVVTRAASDSSLGKEFASQIFNYPKAILGTAIILLVLGLVPGLPHIAFLLLAAITGGVAYLSHQESENSAEEEVEKAVEEEPKEVDDFVPVDPLAIEVGYRLISLVDASAGGELLERIKAMRQQIQESTGFVVPPIHMKDNLRIKPEEYVFLLRGVEIGRGSVMVERHMAIDPGNAQQGLEGIPAKEPAFGLPAIWVDEDSKERAKIMGYTVVTPPIVIVTHLTEIVRKTSHELLSRQDVQIILDSLAQHHPKVVEELVPANLSLGGVQKVLQNLLRDGVPIKDMLSIIETIADHAPSTKDTDIITEHVRKALARTITKQLTGDGDQLPVMIVDPRVEDAIRKSFSQPEGGHTALQPLFTQKFMERVAEGVQEVVAQGYHPILMTSPDLRSIMSKMMRQALPTISVIATNEVAGEVKIKNVKVVSVDDAYEKV